MNNKFNKFAVLGLFGMTFCAGCVVPGAYTYDTYGTTTYTTGGTVYAPSAYPASVTYVETTTVEPVLVTTGHRMPPPRPREMHRHAPMHQAHGRPAAPMAHAAPKSHNPPKPAAAPKVHNSPRATATHRPAAAPKPAAAPNPAAAPKTSSVYNKHSMLKLQKPQNAGRHRTR